MNKQELKSKKLIKNIGVAKRLAGINPMEPIKFFDSVEHLEPKCPKCSAKIEYGITTQWSEEKQAHICNNCGEILK